MMKSPEPIAILGMGLRFPGADSPVAFWRLLREGRDEIREAPAARGLGAARGGFLNDFDAFDWRAFRMPPREVRQMDPQHRLLLMAAWNAIEDAGIPFEDLLGTHSSVFAGLNFNDYHQLLTRDTARIDGYTVLGNVPAFAANRISYTFGLKGQSLSLNAACASSLAAVHHACQSLRSGEADFALAAGVELVLSPDSTSMLSQAGVLSSSGHCRALDGRADGYLRGEGAAVILLRRLADVRPGDRVYALIRGSALNHNGRNEWLMAANAEAQADAIREACERSGVDPAAIAYVELHGSALPKGDVAELEAVAAALRGTRSHAPCRIGAVTNNIGYLGAAGGMAGVIKLALSLHHGQLAPTIHVETAPVGVSLDELSLRLQLTHEDWPASDGPAVAGVLSTSLGGANAFTILSSAERHSPHFWERNAPLVLPLSAHTQPALRDRVRDFRMFLDRDGLDESALYGICYTAAVRRSHHSHRMAVVGNCRAELLAGMDAWLEGSETQTHEIAASYDAGDDLAWNTFFPEACECVDLPLYPFQTERFWPEWLKLGEPASPQLVSSTEATGEFLQRLQGTPASRRGEVLLNHIHRLVLELLEIDPSEPLRTGQRLFDFGLNSMSIVQLQRRLETDLEVALPVSVFFEYGTLELLADHLLTRSQRVVLRPTDEPARSAAMRRQIEQLSESEAESRLLEKIRALEEMHR